MIFNKIKTSFRAVKRDMNALKYSVSEWVVYLNSNQRAMKAELAVLKQRVRELESEAYLKI